MIRPHRRSNTDGTEAGSPSCGINALPEDWAAVGGIRLWGAGQAMALLLALASCSSQKPADTAAVDMAEAGGPAASDPLEERARQALAALVGKNEDILLSDVKSGALDSICGRVKVGDAAARPFLVTPAGTAEIAREEEIRFADPADAFAGFYLSLCATPQEAEAAEWAIEEHIARQRALQENALGALPPPAAAADEADQRTGAERRPEPQRGGSGTQPRERSRDDAETFYDAILRPPDDQGRAQ